MKRLPSVGVKDFSKGMFSSDATEFSKYAHLLENIIHDEELGKAVKAKDSSNVAPLTWFAEYVFDSSILSLEDMITISFGDTDKYLVIALRTLINDTVSIGFFRMNTDGTLTYDSTHSPSSVGDCEWLRLSVAGEILRYSFKTNSGTQGVKWYGDLGTKEMFEVDGYPQMTETVSGFQTEDARAVARGVAFGTYSLGTTDIEADASGLYPDEDDYTAPSSTFYKSYKISIQVDDSQESEFADLLVSTTRTAKAVTLPIRVTPEFQKRLTKIHIWRIVSKNIIDYEDSHELIKTLDVSSDARSSIFSTNIIPLLNVNFSHETLSTYTGAGTYSRMRMRCLIDGVPSYLNVGNFVLVTYATKAFFWEIRYVGDGYMTLEYDGRESFCRDELPLGEYPAGGVPSADTFGVYDNNGPDTPSVTQGSVTITSVSDRRLYLDPVQSLSSFSLY